MTTHKFKGNRDPTQYGFLNERPLNPLCRHLLSKYFILMLHIPKYSVKLIDCSFYFLNHQTTSTTLVSYRDSVQTTWRKYFLVI